MAVKDNLQESAVETERFAVSRRTLLGWLYILHGRVLTWCMAVAAAVPACLAVCLSDWCWVVVSLMMVCILTPMAMALLYVNYALDGECAYNVLPHTLALTEEGVLVRVYVPEMKDKEADGNVDADIRGDKWNDKWDEKWNEKRTVDRVIDGERVENNGRSEDDGPSVRMMEMMIRYGRLNGIRSGLDSVAVWGYGRALVVIPSSAFVSVDGMAGFVAALRGRVMN